ncbi:hypothetical protein C7447_101568 [Tenacibaculum adriaticum]|uniref:Endonuclease/exonuclease/phosphatase domain-containing protein n=1 Tax=Tenacibaculum adriaticum TaxID=413713 RepID=A0A5S5DVD7_9FLAO|nr:endonuclease/exonuclease/phosphatase family protein [Tenacibaculum adriaticum]TYP99960.1 hypothetical protein C7447_101568 [Tenacibaculum adriaticum]
MKLSQKQIFTVAFYNVENLFDTVDNPLTADDDFTAKSKRRWTLSRYGKKIKKLSSVISQLGTKVSSHSPVVVGLVEVENSKVVQDLIRHKNLHKHDYGFVHYDSPDERGIDVALLYDKKFFEVISSKTYSLELTDDNGDIDYTRDVLRVSGHLHGELVHILVNHWPSRREGEEESKHKRIKAASIVHNAINDIKEQISDPKIIIMGDFNDDPTSESVKKNLVTNDFYNPMESLFEEGYGTLTFNGKWNFFDQIIFSKNFIECNGTQHSFLYAEVFNKQWLKIFKGKLKNSPFRTYIGPWYKGGFSDHFPVYTYLEKNQ